MLGEVIFMKKYPFIVMTIIIFLIIGVIFIWNYKDAENNVSVPSNEVINQMPEVDNDVIDNVVEENTTSTENIVKEDEVIVEKPTETVEKKVEETATKKVETSTSSTNKKTTSNTASSTKNVVKEETNNKTTTQEKTPQTTTKPTVENTTQKAENKPNTTEEKVVERCTNTNNHGMGVGNTNKWFSTKAEAIAYYDSEVKRWGDWWEGTDADDTEADATYYKNCPTGYEIWNCMYCSKWTINFYYR